MRDLYAKWEYEHSPVELPEGITVCWYYDPDVELMSDDLVALGCVITDTSFNYEIDSCWGIVVPDNEEVLIEFVLDNMGLPSALEHAQEQVLAAHEILGAAHRRLIRAIESQKEGI